MSKKKIKDIKEPDAFLTGADKLGQFLVKYKSALGGLILVLILVGGGYVAQKEMSKTAEKEAANALYSVEQKINKKQKDLQTKEDELNKPADSKKAKTKIKNTELKKLDINFEKEFSNLTNEYETLIIQHKDTTSALTAAFQITNLYFEHNKYELAKKLLDNFDVSSNNVTTPLLHMLKATTYNHVKEYEKATSFYKKVIDDKKASHLHGEAFLKLGLTYKSLNDNEKAKEYLTRARDDFSDTEFSKLAKSYLRTLKF